MSTSGTGPKDGFSWGRAFRKRLREAVRIAPKRYEGIVEDMTGTRRSQEEIKRSEEKYRSMFDRATVGIYQSRRDGSLITANATLAAILGYEGPEDFLRRNLKDIYVDPSERERIIERFEPGGRWRGIEARWKKKDGTPIWVQFDSRAVKDPSGRTLYFEGFVQDITEHKQAEQALRESEERYRVLFESNPLPMWVFDTKTLAFLTVNEAAVRLYGFSREEFLSMTLEDIRPPGEIPRLREVLSKLPPGYGEIREAMRHRKKDGTEIFVEGASQPLVFEGRPARIVLVNDVTERLRTSEEIERFEARHRSIFDFANLGIFQSLREGSLIAANTRLASIVGYESLADLLGKNMYEIYADPTERDRLLARAEAEPGARAQLLWKRKDGVQIWVELELHAVPDEQGQTSYFEGLVQEITERKRREEEMHQLQEQLIQFQKIEAVGQLAGGIAHDFNNLMTAIAGFTELLLEALPPTDPRRAHAEEIRKAGERAASLTRQLLAVGRRQVLEPKVLDLNATISGMKAMLESLVGEDIEFQLREAPDLGRVRADPGQLEQAVLNLVLNAQDAMPDGGHLSIETANAQFHSGSDSQNIPAGRYVMIAVRDSGVGMTPEVKARVFEPFFTTKGPGKGTGLGLSTTHGIVKQSGGHIWFDSEPGQGSTFKVYLPRVDEALEKTAPAPVAILASPKPGAETILLVEDDPEVRSLVQRLLKIQGYHVLAASHPEEGLAIAREFPGTIDLMVTDVIMPGISGRQLADRLACVRPQTKVLYISGYTDDAIVHHGVLDPGTAFLQKPFTPQALARKVREVLDSPVHS